MCQFILRTTSLYTYHFLIRINKKLNIFWVTNLTECIAVDSYTILFKVNVKYADTGTAMEFAIDSLQVTLRNAPLAPSDPAHAQRFEADAIVRLEVPVRFGGRILPSMWITLKVQAGYTEVF